jgi:hypothetical protein
MSKLTIESFNQDGDEVQLIFLSDMREGVTEFQFDMLDKNGKSFFDDQISITKGEARVLISFLTTVLSNEPF